MNSITIHKQQYEYHSWEMLGAEMFSLAKKILEDGRKFDRIIALAKGGLTFSRSLVDYLDVKGLSSIQIEFYTGINTTAKTPVVTQSLPTSIQDERVLIFDDIVDKGETMQFAVEYVKYYGVKEITTAALVSKPWSKFKVDYSARSSEAWVIFPHEVRETIHLLRETWSARGDQPDMIRAQLLDIGFPEAEVEFFTTIK